MNNVTGSHQDADNFTDRNDQLVINRQKARIFVHYYAFCAYRSQF